MVSESVEFAQSDGSDRKGMARDLLPAPRRSILAVLDGFCLGCERLTPFAVAAERRALTVGRFGPCEQCGRRRVVPTNEGEA